MIFILIFFDFSVNVEYSVIVLMKLFYNFDKNYYFFFLRVYFVVLKVRVV